MRELISIKSVYKVDEQGSHILKNMNTKIFDGQFITIIGPSGSGKSTLLHLLNRMIEPDQGNLTYYGIPYQELNVLELRRKVGMVFQTPTMLQGTVRDNLMVGPKLHNNLLTEKEIDKLLLQVGLPASTKEQDAKTLSGGQSQRVALARTLANDPEILLLDEVTSSLDINSSNEIEELITRLHHDHGKTIIWVTHNLDQAKRTKKYTWVLVNGQLVEEGKTEEVFSKPKHNETRNFIFGFHKTPSSTS